VAGGTSGDQVCALAGLSERVRRVVWCVCEQRQPTRPDHRRNLAGRRIQGGRDSVQNRGGAYAEPVGVDGAVVAPGRWWPERATIEISPRESPAGRASERFLSWWQSTRPSWAPADHSYVAIGIARQFHWIGFGRRRPNRRRGSGAFSRTRSRSALGVAPAACADAARRGAWGGRCRAPL
jgi:hypothetical protein